MSSVHNFHRDFLWRVAGFPCEDLEQFGLDGLADEIRSIILPSAADSWSSWWRSHEQLLGERRLRERFLLDFGSLRQLLGLVVGEPRFQAAVAYSSPAAANVLWSHFSAPPGVRNSKCKRRELLAMRYLQRFVTKCETAAFVGPTATGRITSVPNQVDYRFDPAGYQPTTFLSTRLLRQLSGHLRQDPRVLTNLRVRRRSGVSLPGGSVVSHPSIGVIELRPECVAVLRATACPKRVGELAELAQGWSVELVQIVYALLWLGLLTDELDALPQVPRPLARVEQLTTDRGLALAPAEVDLLRVLSEALEKWSSADARGRSVLLQAVEDAMSAAGIASGMRGAQFYADALAIVEDGVCAGSTLMLDEAWAEALLGELEPALRRSLCNRIPTGTNHVVTSPDVMIVASDVESVRRGDFSVVLSESHSAVGCAGFPTRVIPNCQEWLTSVSDFLAAQLAPAEPVLVTAAPTNKTSYVGPLPGVRYLEVGSPAPEGNRLIYLDDLQVVSDGAARKLVNRGTGAEIALLPNGPQSYQSWLLDPFLPPAFERVRQPGPRQRRGRIVERRESWALTLEDLPAEGTDSFEAFVWTQYVRTRHQLPRWVFLYPAEEQKPICIDSSNPFLCEELLRQVRRNAIMEVEEMHPDPTEAWVLGPDGHHLSELRLLYAAAS